MINIIMTHLAIQALFCKHWCALLNSLKIYPKRSAICIFIHNGVNKYLKHYNNYSKHVRTHMCKFCLPTLTELVAL